MVESPDNWQTETDTCTSVTVKCTMGVQQELCNYERIPKSIFVVVDLASVLLW
jgi:hypothetical protein